MPHIFGTLIVKWAIILGGGYLLRKALEENHNV